MKILASVIFIVVSLFFNVSCIGRKLFNKNQDKYSDIGVKLSGKNIYKNKHFPSNNPSDINQQINKYNIPILVEKPRTSRRAISPQRRNVTSQNLERAYNRVPKLPFRNNPTNKITFNKINTNKKLVAMTFDDGPHPVHTPRLLNMLAKRNIKATFYVIGQKAATHPGILRRMIREGHEVANHSYTHPNFTKLSRASMESQLSKTAKIIFNVTGVHPNSFRPPYGATNSNIKKYCIEKYGYPTILWDVDPKDWKRPGVATVSNRIINGARSGSIILAHDIHQPTIDAMPVALDTLLRRGYVFITVDQLLGQHQSVSQKNSNSISLADNR